MDKAGILEAVDKYLQDEHLLNKRERYEANDERLIEAALEVSQDSKSIMKGLYYDFRRGNESLPRRLKNSLIGKIANIVRNTTEKSLLSQQKFNNQVYYLLETLIVENKKLKAEINQLKQLQTGEN